MPMPPDTLKILQDLEITGDGAAWTQQQQQDENDTQHYEQQQQQQQQQPIGSHGQQPAQPLHHLDPTAAPHPAAPHAHPPEQPHSTTPFYPPLLDHHFALDADSTLPIDPGLLDARFDHPPASGHAGAGVPGLHHSHHHGGHHHFAATQPGSSANMDSSFMVSPAAFTQYTNSPAQLQPGMSSFEPMISTAWSMDGSLPSGTSSRGLTVSSSMSVPSTSTPASSKSPGSPGQVGPGLSSQPPSASRDLSLTDHPGMQLEPWAGGQSGSKRRQTIGPKATAGSGTEKSRSHRNNSSPGFSAPHVPIAPAPITVVADGDDNNKSIDNRKGSSSSSNNNPKHAGKTMTTMTTTTTTTTTTAPKTITTTSNAGGPSLQPQPGPSTTTTTTTTTAAPGHHPPDPRARNREAANRCRAKSKVAVAELEATERALGSEHEQLTLTARSLRNEVLALKTELLMHGNCDDELIQQYLLNSARVVGSGAGTIGGAAGITATVTTTTTTAGGGGTLPGLPLPLQPLQLPGPPGTAMPPLGGGVGGVVGSSSRVMPSVSPPSGLSAMLPGTSSGAPGAGPPPPTTTTTTMTTARGRGSAGGRMP